MPSIALFGELSDGGKESPPRLSGPVESESESTGVGAFDSLALRSLGWARAQEVLWGCSPVRSVLEAVGVPLSGPGGQICGKDTPAPLSTTPKCLKGAKQFTFIGARFVGPWACT